jgi:hypothetical protein
MSTSRKEYLIDRDKEYQLIEQLCTVLHEGFPELYQGDTLVMMVSPDYSATVAMHIAHELSYEGDMADMLPIQVPYPDQNVAAFIALAADEMLRLIINTGSEYKYVLLVEAAVIRGTNYEWLTELTQDMFEVPVITAALLENTGSSYKSDVVAEYYDNELQDVTFYYERFNKHWQ